MDAIESVREGMDVFTTYGRKVGTIASVKMGDPEAITARGQQPEETGGIVGAIASAFGSGTDLPEERKERLLRLGYIEIDGTGFGNHIYEAATAVDRVTEEGVFLNRFATVTQN